MRALIVGIANQQITVPVPTFPLAYEPVRYLPGQVGIVFAGVGFNQARQLRRLGDDVQLIAPLAADVTSKAILAEAAAIGIDASASTLSLPASPRSVVLVDPDGRRMINTDLGEAATAPIDRQIVSSRLPTVEVLLLGNSKSCRPLVSVARAAGTPIAVDLQVVGDPDDVQLAGFLEADVVTLSHEAVGPVGAADLLTALRSRSRARLMVITMGRSGCLAAGQGIGGLVTMPAIPVRGQDTTGAGDCFFASLVHFLIGENRPSLDAIGAATAATADFLRR